MKEHKACATGVDDCLNALHGRIVDLEQRLEKLEKLEEGRRRSIARATMPADEARAWAHFDGKDNEK